MIGKGIVIKESLTAEVVALLYNYVIEEYDHLLDHVKPVSILKIDIDFNIFKNISYLICEALVDKRFYAHFIFGDKMYVIYKNVIVNIEKNQLDDIRFCQSIGYALGIEQRLLKFNELFVKDHPND